MRVLIIVNPISGAAHFHAALAELHRLLRRQSVQIDHRVTHAPGVARTWACQAADQADAVIAVGGDGTVCEVADGLAGSQVPLLIWPRGTENLVAKSLGFQADPRALARTLFAGRTRTIDLGWVNGRSFVVVAGAGFDAEVVHRLTVKRQGHITHLTYFWPLWRTFWEHRWPDLHIEGQGPKGAFTWQGRGMLFIGNMSRYSLGLPVVRDARDDDGLLDACFMTCRNHTQLIAHSLRTVLARHIEHPLVRYAQVTHLTARSTTPVPIELDGDFGGWLPLDVQVRPAAVHVRVPPDRHDRNSRPSTGSDMIHP